ncbi:MAG: hypothetical protein K2X34_02065 [Hyphomonadaceae bacterium]|nr:hypothetical protein [Hyphomonadaceae bacterium]MBY0565148.1 hypothetical protein [Hyphomonadaceae bacterium]
MADILPSSLYTRGYDIVSGIFGRVELDGRPIDPTRFLSAADCVRPFGGDNTSTWIDGPTAAARHLLEIGAQSRFESALEVKNELLVVADAILDNRGELARSLCISETDLKSLADTELIRLSYERWGERCAQRLVGDFAFAVVSPRTGHIRLFRDHIGSRPLFWAQRQQTFLFSSSIGALVSNSEWRWRISSSVIAEYLLCPFVPVSRPFFEDVHAVPPGGMVAMTAGQVTSELWWRPHDIARAPPVRAQHVVEASRCALDQAVAARCDTPYPVAAHCSGGLDSTGVTAVAAKLLRAEGRSLQKAYAWSPPISDAYPTRGNDERVRLETFSTQQQVVVEFGLADAQHNIALLHRPMEFEGEADLSDEIPTLEAAGRDRVRVLLSGWGGDEAFSAHGFGYLGYTLLRGRLRSARDFGHSFTRSLKNPRTLMRLFWHQILHPMLPDPLYSLLSPHRNGGVQSYISPYLSAYPLNRWSPVAKFGLDPRQNVATHLSVGHLAMRMCSWAAWAAPHRFQYRYPLTDKRLLEFLLSLPADQLLLDNRPRGLARATLADCLPTDASKNDVANEALRMAVRDASWRILAERVRQGHYSKECPWVDMRAFRSAAAHPLQSATPSYVSTFSSVFAAARVFHLFERADQHGWL